MPKPWSRPWSRMRASDRDRDRVNEVLQHAFAEGRLRPEEYKRRMDRVLQARTYGELEQVVVDLPGAATIFAPQRAASPGGAQAPSGWGAPATPGAPAPPGWGAPAGHVPPAQGDPQQAVRRRASKRATQTIVTGVLGVFTLGPLAVAAVILGHRALRKIKESGGEGFGRAVTGLVLGYFGTALWTLAWISSIAGD